MPKQLTVHNATIATAKVEVKTLTISGKQVTLAVFRQLREEQLLAEDGRLLGEPWGYVNYHPDKCEGGNPHWHFVWQRGDDLLRSRVDKKPGFDHKGSDEHMFVPGVGGDYVKALILDWLDGRIVESPIADDHTGRSPAHPWAARYDLTYGFGFPVSIPLTKEMAAALEARRNAEAGQYNLERAREERPNDDLKFWEKMAKDSAETLLQVRASFGQAANLGDRNSSRLAEATNAAVHAEHQRRERHRAARRALAELPQLFIAV